MTDTILDLFLVILLLLIPACIVSDLYFRRESPSLDWCLDFWFWSLLFLNINNNTRFIETNL